MIHEMNFEEPKSNVSESNSHLVNILLSPSLKSDVLAKNSALFNSFQKDSIITELAEWSFTTKYKQHPKYDQISKTAVSVLLSSPVSLIQYLLNSLPFTKVLYNFLVGNDSKMPILCSHFTEVLSTQIKFGTPKLFTNYPKIQKYLLNRLEILSIRYLIQLLIISNVDNFNSEQMIKDLCSLADENMDENAAHLLISIYRMVQNDPKFKTLFNNNNVINHLLNLAINTNSIVIQSDVFNCLSNLNFNIETISDQQLIEKLIISEDNINDLSISAIDIGQIPIEKLVLLFFNSKATIRLHQKILNLMENCNLRELVEIANTQDFVVNLISAFGTKNWCPHCIQIVQILSSIEIYCKPLKSKRWRTFIRDKFYKIIRIMNNEYGGIVPIENSEYGNDQKGRFLAESDDSDNEEIKNMTFEEEEEFYDDDVLYYVEDGCEVENIESSDNDDGEFEIDV